MVDRPGAARSYRFKASWRKQRAEVIKRDGGYCALCGSTVGLTQAHVVAESEGGSNGIENVVLLCRVCHGICDGGARRGKRAR